MSLVCIKNLSLSLEFKVIKLSFNSKAFSNKECLKSEYSSHSNKFQWSFNNVEIVCVNVLESAEEIRCVFDDF